MVIGVIGVWQEKCTETNLFGSSLGQFLYLKQEKSMT